MVTVYRRMKNRTSLITGRRQSVMAQSRQSTLRIQVACQGATRPCRAHKKNPRRKAEGLSNQRRESAQPQLPELQPPLLQPPPPPLTGIREEMVKPERMPLSTKSTLIAPQFFISSLSTRKVRPPSSTLRSLSFGSSRAKPSEGPAQPPCIKATRRAEVILFCSR